MSNVKSVLPQGFIIFSFPLASVIVYVGGTIEFDVALIFIVVFAVHPLASVTVISIVFIAACNINIGLLVVGFPLIVKS